MYTGSESAARKQAVVEEFVHAEADDPLAPRVLLMSLRSAKGSIVVPRSTPTWPPEDIAGRRPAKS